MTIKRVLPLLLLAVGVAPLSASAGSTIVVTSSISSGASLRGSVVWTAAATGATVRKLEFSIDGKLRWTEFVSPYQYGGDPDGRLDTTTLKNGSHTLSVKAYSTTNRSALAKNSVTVSNGASPPTLSGSIPAPGGTPQSGQTLTGATGYWTGAQPMLYAFQWQRCDASGTGCSTIVGATAATYTASASDVGSALRARVTASNSAGSSSASSGATGVVVQAAVPLSVSSSIVGGSVLSGSVVWTATASGSVSKIEFWVDGALKWTENSSPYRFGGDLTGMLDTTTLANGAHTLSVEGYATGGGTATVSSSVTVSNVASPPPPPPSPSPPPPAPPPSTSYADKVGFASHTIYMTSSDQVTYMQKAVGEGVTWLREDFAWSVLEPTKGAFNWAPSDTLMRNAAQLSLHILPIITYSPGWASGHPGDDKYGPQNPQDYANFALQVVNRYGPGGSFWATNPSLTPSPITVIELWNEPWLWAFWKPQPDPSAYNRLVRATATTIKAVRSDIRIMASADWNQGRSDSAPTVGTWFPNVLSDDTSLYTGTLVDLYSVHLYCEGRSPLDSTTNQIWRYDRVFLSKSAADAKGASKPFWDTEFGWSTNGDVDEATQGTYVHDAVKLAVEQWGSFLERSFVYVWEKPDNSSYVGAYNLLHDDGSAKPAWNSLATLIATGT